MRKKLLFILSILFCIKANSQFVLDSYRFSSGTLFTPDTIQINVYDSASNAGKMANANPGGNNYWNQWSMNLVNNTEGVKSSAYLKNRQNVATGVRVTGWGQSGGESYSDNGAGYGAASTANSTGFPDTTFWVAAYAQVTKTLSITGLDNAGTYTIKILSSRNSGTSRPQTFTIGSGVSQDASLNKSTLVTFTGKTPSSGAISCVITFTNGFCYVNAIQIIRTG